METRNDIDKLIAESIRRQEMVEEINRSVMKHVKADMRKHLIVAWLKRIAFSFGLPLMIGLPLMTMIKSVQAVNDIAFSLSVGVSALFFLVPTLMWANNKIKEISSNLV